MPGRDKYDLIVIGGGVLGAFCAYHALDLGLSVALIERTKLPREGTVRNFGQIVPSGLSSHWRQFGRKSLEIYKDLQSRADFTVRHNGSFYVASDEDEQILLDELSQMDEEMDYQSIPLSKKAACEALPGLRSDYCKSALYYPDEVSVDPRQMIHRVIQFMIEQWELAFFPYNIAQDIEIFGARTCRVTCNTGLFLYGEQVIVCNGAEYQFLFPDEYRNDEISCVKIHMLSTMSQPTQRIQGNVLSGLSIRRYEAFRECPSWDTIAARCSADPRIAQWGIHLLFKQSDSGQVIIGDAHHYADAHDKEELGFDLEQDVVEFILEQAKRIFDLETYTLQAQWFGVYSQAKQKDIITKSFDDRVHILNAIGGKGMTAGPGYTYFHIRKCFGYD